MLNPQPTYELKTDSDLSKFLLGAIRDVRKNELDVERATVISQLADKYTKNEIMRCIKARIDRQNGTIDLKREINRAITGNRSEADDSENQNL